MWPSVNIPIVYRNHQWSIGVRLYLKTVAYVRQNLKQKWQWGYSRRGDRDDLEVLKVVVELAELVFWQLSSSESRMLLRDSVVRRSLTTRSTDAVCDFVVLRMNRVCAAG
ncbi:unnamed protein product [Toxocara canis]|uniref:Transposase n=1 Tax=Toxocara canis TaxID=6265 RepID=A0A183UIX2_TOXCA|nr:unnamed protein product [Toxocara canis]